MAQAKVGPATMRKVNAALAARGHAEELVKGRGYFYFAGGEAALWPSSSVMVYRLTDLTVGGWCDERDALAAAYDGPREPRCVDCSRPVPEHRAEVRGDQPLCPPCLRSRRDDAAATTLIPVASLRPGTDRPDAGLSPAAEKALADLHATEEPTAADVFALVDLLDALDGDDR